MSFTKIKFSYTPPPTALPQALQSNPDPLPASASANDLAKSSAAAALINRLRDMKATAEYLVELIQARSASIGVRPNYNSDPELGMSLSRIYSSPGPPSGISLPMYVNLLDADMGVTRAEMALSGSGSVLQISPMQKADLMRTTAAFEDALSETGEFRHQLPLLLRELKGDVLVFDSLIGSLQEYPILKNSEFAAPPPTETSTVFDNGDWTTVENQPLSSLVDTTKVNLNLGVAAAGTPAGEITNSLPETQVFDVTANADAAPIGLFFNPADEKLIDINAQTAAEIDHRLDKYQNVFGAMYDLATGIDEAYQFVGQIANQYLYENLNRLILVLSTLSSLRALFHKPKLKDLKAMISVMVMPRLIAEVGQFNFLMDRVMQRVTDPVQAVLSSMHRLMGEVSNVANDVAYLAAGGGKAGAGLTGVVRSSISGTNKLPSPGRIKELDAMPRYMALLGGKLSWGLQEAKRQRATVEDSMLKAMDRKIAGSGDRVEMLESLRSLDAMSGILKSLILERQRGSLQNVSLPSATQKVEAMGNIVKNLQSESGTSFRVDAGSLVAKAPNLPEPTQAVSAVLVAGGANRVENSSLVRIKMDSL